MGDAAEHIKAEPDREADHPWYGPCDWLTADGGCAECEKLRAPGYRQVMEAYWRDYQDWASREAERRQERKKRKRRGWYDGRMAKPPLSDWDQAFIRGLMVAAQASEALAAEMPSCEQSDPLLVLARRLRRWTEAPVG